MVPRGRIATMRQSFPCLSRRCYEMGPTALERSCGYVFLDFLWLLCEEPAQYSDLFAHYVWSISFVCNVQSISKNWRHTKGESFKKLVDSDLLLGCSPVKWQKFCGAFRSLCGVACSTCFQPCIHCPSESDHNGVKICVIVGFDAKIVRVVDQPGALLASVVKVTYTVGQRRACDGQWEIARKSTSNLLPPSVSNWVNRVQRYMLQSFSSAIVPWHNEIPYWQPYIHTLFGPMALATKQTPGTMPTCTEDMPSDKQIGA